MQPVNFFQEKQTKNGVERSSPKTDFISTRNISRRKFLNLLHFTTFAPSFKKRLWQKVKKKRTFLEESWQAQNIGWRIIRKPCGEPWEALPLLPFYFLAPVII